MSPHNRYGAPAELVWSEINLDDINYDERHELIRDIPNSYGVYIFHRRYGNTGEALYIGKSVNLRTRIIQELNARKLIEHVQGAKRGAKLLSFAEMNAHGNCNFDQYIEDIESMLIVEAIDREDNLFNIKKTKTHLREITSSGETPAFVEPLMYLPK